MFFHNTKIKTKNLLTPLPYVRWQTIKYPERLSGIVHAQLKTRITWFTEFLNQHIYFSLKLHTISNMQHTNLSKSLFVLFLPDASNNHLFRRNVDLVFNFFCI